MNFNKYFLILIYCFAFHANAVDIWKYKSWSDNDYSFNYPDSWSLVAPDENEDENCTLLKMQSSQSDPDKIYDFRICKYYESIQTASEKSVFTNQNGKWIASGSMDQKIAKIKYYKNKVIIETASLPTCGITDADGVFHSAGGGCYSAIVGNKKIAITLQSTGDRKDVELMRYITKSVVLKLK